MIYPKLRRRDKMWELGWKSTKGTTWIIVMGSKSLISCVRFLFHYTSYAYKMDSRTK